MKKSKKRETGQPAEDTSFLEIDLLKLEEEWVKQPKLAAKWMKRLADARRVLDDAKDNLELVEAQLQSQIREDPEKFDLRKATDKSVEATVIIQDEYQEAKKEVREATHQVGLLSAMTTAIDHKKKGLEKEVDLFGMGYFAVPKASERSRELAHKMEEKELRSRGRK